MHCPDDLQLVDWLPNPELDCQDVGTLLLELSRDPSQRKRGVFSELEYRLLDVTAQGVHPAASQAVPFLAFLAVHSPFTETRIDTIQMLKSMAECLQDSLLTLTPGCVENNIYIALQAEKRSIESMAGSADLNESLLRQAIIELVQLLNCPHTPCPRCALKLATPSAQQCLHCGADWHS